MNSEKHRSKSDSLGHRVARLHTRILEEGDQGPSANIMEFRNDHSHGIVND